MSAVNNKETASMMQGVQQGSKPRLAQQIIAGAVGGVKTVAAEVGWAPLAGGVALYLAKIREADRDARMHQVNHKFKSHHVGRDYER